MFTRSSNQPSKGHGHLCRSEHGREFRGRKLRFQLWRWRHGDPEGLLRRRGAAGVRARAGILVSIPRPQLEARFFPFFFFFFSVLLFLFVLLVRTCSRVALCFFPCCPPAAHQRATCSWLEDPRTFDPLLLYLTLSHSCFLPPPPKKKVLRRRGRGGGRPGGGGIPHDSNTRGVLDKGGEGGRRFPGGGHHRAADRRCAGTRTVVFGPLLRHLKFFCPNLSRCTSVTPCFPNSSPPRLFYRLFLICTSS